MSWYEVKFPEDTFGFDSPEALIESAKVIYKQANFPEGFGVFQEIDHTYSRNFYFNPVATEHCVNLFKSYRGRERSEPVYSGKPIIWVAGDQNLLDYFSASDDNA
jgi:hypothetical protein